MSDTDKSNYRLIQVKSAEDWEIYHGIRRKELFDARGRGGIYEENHPDEHVPQNFPLLLKWKGRGIGTTRLDMRSNSNAAIRLVAVVKSDQGKGHGRELAKQVEEFARRKGVKKLMVNAYVEAVGYYEKLGYGRDKWDPSDLVGISANSIQMSKLLA